MRLRGFRSSQKGGSLIELLTALIISAIVTAVAVPSLNSVASATSLKGESARVAALLELCTVKALLLREDIVLKAHPHELIARSFTNPKKPLVRRSIRGGVDVRLGRPELRFYSSGAATPATIHLRNRNHHCKVSLSLRGRAVVECDKVT